MSGVRVVNVSGVRDRAFTVRVRELLRKRTDILARAPCELEFEARLGIVRDRATHERTAAGPSATFDATVNAWYFYAAFEALARRPGVALGARHTSTTRMYARAPRTRLELDDAAGERWLLKMPYAEELVSAASSSMNTWFDVRLALAEERVLDARPALLLADERPAHERVRERRAMHFADAPAWRLDWTRVSTSDTSAPTFNIELEYVARADNDDDDDAAVTQLVSLLDTLANVLGSSPRARRALLERAAREYNERLERALD